VGEDEAVLDKRPVRPRKKRRSKKRSKRSKVTAKPKEQQLEQEAIEAQATGEIGPTPVPLEEADPKESGAVTFFSKFKMDEIIIEPSRIQQLGPNKFITLPARIARFNKHRFTTEDREVIDYIRNPNGAYEKFDRFGVEIFEVGRPDHEEHIHRVSDAGIQEYLYKLHTNARKIATREKFSYEDTVVGTEI
jgi:hypothetical protein